MQSLGTFNSSTPAFLDACAAVKLVIKEPGSEHASANFLNRFNPAGRYFITSFCLFEALGVLKRKMLNDEIAFDQYLYLCWLLLNYVDTHRLEIHDEPKISSFDTFMRAKPLAERYSLDLSDALQLVSLKYGPFSHYVQESTPLLVTVDGGLENAARSEGLRVWNCQNDANPPKRLDHNNASTSDRCRTDTARYEPEQYALRQLQTPKQVFHQRPQTAIESKNS